MEKRLQLLLDVPRYARVEKEAARSGRSVAAVIREAIDFRFPDDEHNARTAAAAQLLLDTQVTEPEAPGLSPEEFKAEYDALLGEKVPQ